MGSDSPLSPQFSSGIIVSFNCWWSFIIFAVPRCSASCSHPGRRLPHSITPSTALHYVTICLMPHSLANPKQPVFKVQSNSSTPIWTPSLISRNLGLWTYYLLCLFISFSISTAPPFKAFYWPKFYPKISRLQMCHLIYAFVAFSPLSLRPIRIYLPWSNPMIFPTAPQLTRISSPISPFYPWASITGRTIFSIWQPTHSTLTRFIRIFAS